MGRLVTGFSTRISTRLSVCPRSFQGPIPPQSAGEVFSPALYDVLSPPLHRFLAAAGPDLHITEYGLGKVNKEIVRS